MPGQQVRYVGGCKRLINPGGNFRVYAPGNVLNNFGDNVRPRGARAATFKTG